MSNKQELKEGTEKKDAITKIINAFQAPFGATLRFIDQFISFIFNKELTKDNEVIAYARQPLSFGLLVVFIFIVCGGLWAGFAPLDSAAHAQGVVISEVPKQLVQANQANQLSKVQKCFVRQGDVVNENQVLLEFENKVSRTRYMEAIDAYLEYIAIQDRLIAQKDNKTEVYFSRILVEHQNIPRIRKIMERENSLFHEALKLNLNADETAQKQMDEYILAKSSSQSKIKCLEEKVKYLEETLLINQNLEKKGFAPKLESTRLSAEKAAYANELHQTKNALIGINIAIQKLEIENLSRHNKILTEVLQQLEKNSITLLEAQSKLAMCEEAFQATFIRSPIKGIVNYIAKEQIIGGGNIVGCGNIVADITPIDENLVIEVKIPANVIDNVRLGQVTKVNFMAFNSRVSPTFSGTLIALSPNVMSYMQQGGKNQQQQAPVYTGLIKMDQAKLDKFLKQHKLKLITGMMADVQIVTGERTLLRYLLDPILDQSFKAFTEK